MQGLRTLIVDDEPLARERIRRLLLGKEGFDVVGECGDGAEALTAVRRDRPDVVFLDIQMPGLNGMEVLERLGSDLPPAVVFVTAFDHYAVQAFEFHAVDYLLKPMDRGRFLQALDRVIKRVRNPESEELQAKVGAMLEDIKAGASSPERIPIRNNGKVIFVCAQEIDWIASADNYVEIHVGTRSHLLRETLTSIAQRLPSKIFVRVSRTAIVNIQRVQELQALQHGEYSVVLKGGMTVRLSRSHRDQLSRFGL